MTRSASVEDLGSSNRRRKSHCLAPHPSSSGRSGLWSLLSNFLPHMQARTGPDTANAAVGKHETPSNGVQIDVYYLMCKRNKTCTSSPLLADPFRFRRGSHRHRAPHHGHVPLPGSVMQRGIFLVCLARTLPWLLEPSLVVPRRAPCRTPVDP